MKLKGSLHVYIWDASSMYPWRATIYVNGRSYSEISRTRRGAIGAVKYTARRGERLRKYERVDIEEITF